jgi:CheY-like chemotaxis protein
MAAKRVLLVGDHAHQDFREAVAWLAQHTELTLAATVADGLAALRPAAGEDPEAAGDDAGSAARRQIPDVMIVAQSRPGQISPQQIERLHAASPLSRLVTLVGTWCEGELRSGRPCTGVIRILWHQWQPRLVPFLQPGSAPVPDTWRMPRTASLDEQFAATVGPAWPRREGLVAIHAGARETFLALSDACHEGGYATVWYPSEQAVAASGVAAALADGVSCDFREVCWLRHVVQRHRPAPVIALLDFVRRQDYELAKAEGVSAVLAKPFLVYDLLWHLDKTIDQASRR